MIPWVQNVVTLVGRVRDGFSSKPDVAASFLPTVAAVANHFWTWRRPRSRLLRQRPTDDAASLPTTAAECSSQVPLGMGRGVQLALWVKRVATVYKQHTARTCKRSDVQVSEVVSALNRKSFHISDHRVV